MKRSRDLVFALILLAGAAFLSIDRGLDSGAHASQPSFSSSTSRSDSPHSSTHSSSRAHSSSVARDSHGRIKRSRDARSSFVRSHPCPSTGKTAGACPGYVVDHTQALACGGADDPSNMQWQTTADGKAKDGWERVGCE